MALEIVFLRQIGWYDWAGHSSVVRVDNIL